MSWKNNDKKMLGNTGPHSDSLINFVEWDKWIMQPFFRKLVGHCTISEYYILPNHQIYKHEMWNAEKKEGRKRRNNKDPNGDVRVDWDIPITAKPLYVLFSWKDAKKTVCCCDLNFHQPIDHFKKHMEFYFPISSAKDQEYEERHFRW